ncbi:MAG: tetratricopeptide repeat protein [Ignavibacteriales bacterium]|nr:tetratricopeptide repeat protein [Ignavibacteriales bacterium]
MNIKYFVLLLLSIEIFPQTQTNTIKFSEAMEYFNKGEFSIAYEILQSIPDEYNVDDDILSTSKYYSAECLLKLNQYNGAINEFEYFAYKYPLSNFREESLYKLGTLYYNQKRFQEAREKFLLLIKDYPYTEYEGTAYYWIGLSLLEENNYSEAENYLIKAIYSYKHNKYPDNTIYSLAYLYEKQNNYLQAIQYFDELLGYYSDSPLAPYSQLRIGICYFMLKKYDNVILELNSPLVGKLPKEESIEAEYLLANSYFLLREYQNSISTFKNLLNTHKNFPTRRLVQYNFAWVYFQKGDYLEAFDIFNSLSNKSQDTISINSLYWSAECKRYNGQPDEALALYNSFLEKYSDHHLSPTIKFNIASIYHDKGEYGTSEKTLIEALKSNDRIVQGKAYTLLGEIRLNEKKFSKATEYFSEALSISNLPQDLINRSKLGSGVALFYEKKYRKAIDILIELSNNQKNFEPDKINFYIAESYFALEKYSNAIAYYKNISTSNAALQKQSNYGLGYCYFNLKEFGTAQNYFNQFINDSQEDEVNIIDAKLRLADSYYGTKNFEMAANTYKQIFTNNRNSIKDDFAYYQYGQSLFKASFYNEAIQEFSNLQKYFPDSKFRDDAQYLIGWIHFQNKQYSSAIKNYKVVPAIYPSSEIAPIAYYSIGDCFYNTANYDSAIVYYNKVLQKYPNSNYVSYAIKGIVDCYQIDNQTERAIGFIDNLANSNYSSSVKEELYIKKGDIYLSSGEYNRAIQSYKDFISKFPNSGIVPNAYYGIGKCSYLIRRSDDAITNYKKVINYYPNSEIYIPTVIELGKIYSQQGKNSEVISLYDNALSKIGEKSETSELLFLKAEALLEMDKINEAYEIFVLIANSYPGTVFADKAKMEIGIFELARENYDYASELFKDLTQGRIDNLGAQAQYYYGLTFFEQGKINDAITAFVRVRSVFSPYDEWYTKSLLRLGDCYVKLGQNEQAREMFRAVVIKHPNDEYGKEANQKLKQL